MSVASTVTGRPVAAGLFHFLLGAAALMVFNLVFAYHYEHHLVPRWGYFGFRFGSNNEASYWNGVVCTLVAYFVLPRQAKAASDYIHWLLFVIAFVPIQLTIGLSNSVPGAVGEYQLALLVSFILSVMMAGSVRKIAWTGKRGKIRSTRLKRTKRTDFVRAFISVAIIVVAFLIVRFHSIMEFSGIDEIYTQRERASLLGIDLLEGYLILWTTYLFAPLIMAIGLSAGRKTYLVLAAALLLTVFMITASKTTFVIFFFALTIHVFNQIGLRNRMYILFAVPILPILLSISLDLSTESSLGTIISYALDQIVIRGIAIQAMIFNLYIEFFASNPHTYYSHVTGISLFVDYPYELPVGREISIYQYGHPEANANSGIWATDGVAAAGALGVVLVGALVGAFLGFANRLTKDVDQDFLSVAILSIAFLMVNVSLFTTLASGGGLLLVILIPRIWRDLQR